MEKQKQIGNRGKSLVDDAEAVVEKNNGEDQLQETTDDAEEEELQGQMVCNPHIFRTRKQSESEY